MKKLVDDCVSSQFSTSLRPHDAVSALGPMYDVHDKSHLPRIEACDFELQSLLEYCKKSKNAMNLCIHTRLQNVAALQSNIRDMRNQLAVFKEAMARQDEIFQELKKVRRVGPSYKACLAEVVRRRAHMKLYMGQVIARLFIVLNMKVIFKKVLCPLESMLVGVHTLMLDATHSCVESSGGRIKQHPSWVVVISLKGGRGMQP